MNKTMVKNTLVVTVGVLIAGAVLKFAGTMPGIADAKEGFTR